MPSYCRSVSINFSICSRRLLVDTYPSLHRDPSDLSLYVYLQPRDPSSCMQVPIQMSRPRFPLCCPFLLSFSSPSLMSSLAFLLFSILFEGVSSSFSKLLGEEIRRVAKIFAVLFIFSRPKRERGGPGLLPFLSPSGGSSVGRRRHEWNHVLKLDGLVLSLLDCSPLLSAITSEASSPPNFPSPGSVERLRSLRSPRRSLEVDTLARRIDKGGARTEGGADLGGGHACSDCSGRGVEGVHAGLQEIKTKADTRGRKTSILGRLLVTSLHSNPSDRLPPPRLQRFVSPLLFLSCLSSERDLICKRKKGGDCLTVCGTRSLSFSKRHCLSDAF